MNGAHGPLKWGENARILQNDENPLELEEYLFRQTHTFNSCPSLFIFLAIAAVLFVLLFVASIVDFIIIVVLVVVIGTTIESSSNQTLNIVESSQYGEGGL